MYRYHCSLTARPRRDVFQRAQRLKNRYSTAAAVPVATPLCFAFAIVVVIGSFSCGRCSRYYTSYYRTYTVNETATGAHFGVVWQSSQVCFFSTFPEPYQGSLLAAEVAAISVCLASTVLPSYIPDQRHHGCVVTRDRVVSEHPLIVEVQRPAIST